VNAQHVEHFLKAILITATQARIHNTRTCFMWLNIHNERLRKTQSYI